MRIREKGHTQPDGERPSQIGYAGALSDDASWSEGYAYRRSEVPAARQFAAEDCKAQAVSPQRLEERQTSRGGFVHKSVLQSCHQGHVGDKHNDHSYA